MTMSDSIELKDTEKKILYVLSNWQEQIPHFSVLAGEYRLVLGLHIQTPNLFKDIKYC